MLFFIDQGDEKLIGPEQGFETNKGGGDASKTLGAAHLL